MKILFDLYHHQKRCDPIVRLTLAGLSILVDTSGKKNIFWGQIGRCKNQTFWQFRLKGIRVYSCLLNKGWIISLCSIPSADFGNTLFAREKRFWNFGMSRSAKDQSPAEWMIWSDSDRVKLIRVKLIKILQKFSR